MGIVVFLLVFTAVIFIHEMGHYLACRALGIPVLKFAVGVGKPIVTYKPGVTEWSLRPFPLGGFIEPDKIPMTYAKPWKKAVVAVAGPAANIVPFLVGAALVGKLTASLKLLGMVYVLSITALIKTVMYPIDLLLGTAGKLELSGPIGIGADTVASTAASGAGVTAFGLFLALSIGLGLINLVPVPLLDGGRIVLAGVEQVIGFKRTQRVEKVTNVIGAVIILTLLVVITIGDIGKLF